MWIFCCGMMRSGSTVQYQITKDIVETSGTGYGLGWIEVHDFPEAYASQPYEEQRLVVKTHAFTEKIGEVIASGEGRAIYVHRDIRDVTVSLMHKRKKSFWYILLATPFMEMVLENHKDWTSQPGILVSKYEEMIADLKQEVLRIANYLEIPLKETEAEQIASKHALERQIAKVKQLETSERQSGNMLDSELLFHRNHIHSGQVGQWVNSLTTSQVRLLETLARDTFETDRDYKGNRTSLIVVRTVKILNKVLVFSKSKLLSVRGVLSR